jgi:serine O-acetyltransferase
LDSPVRLTWRNLCADYKACSGESVFRWRFLVHPGFQVSILYRCARYFHLKKQFVLARCLAVLMRWITGCDIHHGADLGAGIQFPHGMGVVVGDGVRIGPKCSLFQFTTLGASEGRDGAPLLEEGVNIYPGTVLAGNITIGEYSRIGPNVYLTESVPSHTRLAPAKPHMSRKEPHV